MKIQTVLTDNGSQFTDRFTRKTRTPSGKHAFDRRCAALGIEHRLCPPRHPQTNGMVERFNGRISEVIGQTRFKSAQELETTLMHYLATYNHRIPQRALDHLSPVQALKQWRTRKPELFLKRVYEQPGLDTYRHFLKPPLRQDAVAVITSRIKPSSFFSEEAKRAMTYCWRARPC